MTFQQFTYRQSEHFMKQYEVGECIGEGSEGKVYFVWDKSVKRPLALKVLPIDTEEKKLRYEKQIQMLKQFGGLYFPVLVNTFTEEKTGSILMEYVEGENLKTVIDREKGMEQKKALYIIDEICRALSQLHKAKEPVVFCDLKAENVILQKDKRVKIIDFGGAAFVGEKQRDKGVGTYGYAPKEQWDLKKEVSIWWDIFALNKLFHYMLTGNNPAMPPYTTPSILEFNVTLPKTWNQVLLKYCDEEKCRATDVDEYRRAVTLYQKKEIWYWLKEFIIKGIGYGLFIVSILIFYKAVWNQNIREILKNKEILYASLELFLIAIIYQKICINKFFSNRYYYRREKNIWKSARKGIFLFPFLIFVTGFNTKAGRENDTLPVVFYNDARESVCIREDAVLKVKENILIEIPIEKYENGERYELEITCKSKDSDESLERKILFEKKP